MVDGGSDVDAVGPPDAIIRLHDQRWQQYRGAACRSQVRRVDKAAFPISDDRRCRNEGGDALCAV